MAFTATQIPNIDGRRYPTRAGRPAVSRGHPDPSRGGAASADPRAPGRPGGLRVQRRVARDRHAQGVAGAGLRRRLPADRPQGHHARRARARRLGVRGAHRQRQEPDDAPGGCDPARQAGAASSACATRCPTATWCASACSASPPRRTSTATSARSRSARSTSRTSPRAASSTRGWTTRRSWPRPRRRPTSSSGTAATTTCRSTGPTSRSWWPTRTGRATSAATIRAKRTCAARTWS